MLEFFKIFFRYGIRSSIREIYASWIRNIDGQLGNNLRYAYYKKRLKYLGKNVIIDTGVLIYGAEYISIDDNTHLDKYCILVASSPHINLSKRTILEVSNENILPKGEIMIGKDCHISQYAMIYGYYGVKIGDLCTLSANSKIYSLSSLPFNPHDRSEIISIQPYSGKSPTIVGTVLLEDNVWLGLDVVVNPGVKLEKNSFVKTGTVVTKSFPENSYIAGEPAKRIKNRYGDY
ncbi:MAG: acyltransferase [Raineya sp.]|jgi:acetyltransferase-like isoleucine patch superfamily enzyme|nr:acyltransferase [Raineya sp.]